MPTSPNVKILNISLTIVLIVISEDNIPLCSKTKQTTQIMTSILKVAAKTSDKTMSTGALYQKAISKNGYASLEFWIGKSRIGLSIEGIETPHVYFLNPKNDAQKISNERFLNRFVIPCQDSASLITLLGISNQP